MKKPMTTKELFNKIGSILKAQDKFPDILVFCRGDRGDIEQTAERKRTE